MHISSFYKKIISLSSVVMVLSAVLIIGGCATTQKPAEEIGYVGRKFHDMTAKYNGYFNATELYDASKLRLEQSYKDNYNQILDIYTYASVDDPTVVTADMDKAIEKTRKVAGIHQVSQWVDDCYVLMGKAQYLKGDYESAQETFEYFVEDFNPTDPDARNYAGPKTNAKKSKKQREKERKAKEKERKKEQAAKKKAREEERKRRKKGKRSKRTKKQDPPATDVVASTDNTPLSEDDQYLADLANKEAKKKPENTEAFEKGFLKHRPAYYEGMIELTRSYIKRDRYLDAKYYLDKLDREPAVTDAQRREAAVIRADMYLHMKDYSNAIPALHNAIEQTKDKKLKARMTYILAQLYQQKGDAAKASEQYALVAKSRAPYEMKLNAQLAQLRADWVSGSMGRGEALSTLHDLLDERKNEKYKGAIHYTLAEIYLAEGDKHTAMQQFTLALKHSPGGVKADIYYRLGQLFDGQQNYTSAKNYYDSTLILMDKKDERYLAVKSRAARLKEVADHQTELQEQDSLIKLSLMSKEALDAYAMDIIKAREASSPKPEAAQPSVQPTQSLAVGTSRFFAYNPTVLQKGKREFTKRWGNIALDDDWRRSNRSNVSFAEEESEEENGETAPSEKDYSREITEVLREVPTTPEKLEAVNKKREDALFGLGTSARTSIENIELSAKTLDELLSSYPNTEHAEEAYYYQYLNNKDLGQEKKASKYYNLLKKNFPNSPFAIYLDDPTNTEALMTEERRIAQYYDHTYDEFGKGNYEVVLCRIETAEKEYGKEHHMKAKYDLLRAMAIGHTQGQTDYIDALRGVILRHNNTPEQVHAREMLRFLRGDEEAFGGEVSEETLSKFKLADDKLHYVIVLVYGGDGNAINNAKISINKFSAEHFSDWRLRSTSMYLNPEKKTHLVMIRRFKNKEKAMEYYNKYMDDKAKFLNPDEYSYEVFAINQLNYREVISTKSVNGYRIFFEENYLQSEK